jgi:NitT/TauT family transport system permease protein
MPVFILPAPHVVASGIAKHSGELLANAGHTLQETFLGFMLGSAVGFLLAILLNRVAAARSLIYPYLIGSQVVPKEALAPLLVLWFGYGLLPKVIVAALVCMFPVFINGSRGLYSLPPELTELGRVLAARRRDMFVKVELPHTLPYLFAAFKVSIGLALIGAVVGEFITSDKGLGFMVIQGQSRIDTVLLFSALVGLAVLGVALFVVVMAFERLLVPWARARES